MKNKLNCMEEKDRTLQAAINYQKHEVKSSYRQQLSQDHETIKDLKQ